MEKLKRQLRGYHYKNNFVTIPIVEYFTLGNKENLLEAFDLLNSVLDNYTLDDRYKYGFSISNIEYGTSMKKLVLSLQKISIIELILNKICYNYFISVVFNFIIKNTK